jgi:hypothetical protein
MSQPQQLKGGDEMKLYGAIDLHSTNNVMVVIDEQDQVVYQKRLPNDLVMIVEQLSAAKGPGDADHDRRHRDSRRLGRKQIATADRDARQVFRRIGGIVTSEAPKRRLG